MSGRGFTFNVGESVCAPKTRKPVEGVADGGTYQAINAPRPDHVPPSGFVTPFFGFEDLLEPRCRQHSGSLGNGVVRRRRLGHISDQIIGVSTVETRHGRRKLHWVVGVRRAYVSRDASAPS